MIEPLTDAEEAQLEAILALLHDDPDRKIPITARLLCKFIEHLRKTEK